MSSRVFSVHCFKKLNQPVVAGVLLGILYLINAVGVYWPEWFWLTSQITNVKGHGNERTIELVEAALWITACISFLALSRHLWRTRNPKRYWCAFFALLCFVAAGEELSWGQHLGFFEPPIEVVAINAQKEFNFHNLNIALLLGLTEDHPLYGNLDNFNKILNPVFYLLCTTLWLVIPILLRSGKSLSKIAIFRSLPIPHKGTMIFFAANLVAYVIVDKLFYDVGELLEFAISITVWLSSFNLWEQLQAEKSKVDAGKS